MKGNEGMKNRSTIWMTILPVLACFALLPAQAISPAPDGCYPNFTTAEGCNALNSLTTGAGNTGLGWFSLSSNTTANFNTEEVAEVNPQLVVRRDGETITVRYEQINNMLL